MLTHHEADLLIVTEEASALLRIQKKLSNIAGTFRYNPEEECPLVTADDERHAELARVLYGPGWSWTCPFCGEQFED